MKIDGDAILDVIAFDLARGDAVSRRLLKAPE